MLNKRAIFFFAIATMIALLFNACKKETEILPADITYQYYPNQKGAFVTYHVDSLFYNLFTSSIDTTSYELKEKIADLFLDEENRMSQRIERFKFINNNWVLTKVWKAYVGNNKVEKTEENISYIKLVFPLKKDLTWNGNTMNSMGVENYKCISIHQPFSIQSMSFDSCSTIMQHSDSTLISKNEVKEIYAMHVGLVYKRSVHLEDRTSQVDPVIPIAIRANTGTDVRMFVTGFGKE